MTFCNFLFVFSQKFECAGLLEVVYVRHSNNIPHKLLRAVSQKGEWGP